MRKWIIQKEDDSVHVVGSNRVPQSSQYKRVLPAPGDPAYDEGSTFDILEVQVNGVTTYQAVQDVGRKATYDSNKVAAEAALQAARDAREAVTNRLRGKKKADLVNDNAVKDVVIDILEFLGLD